ncbi:hypothetical protein C8R44DRAFT_913897, partial [Mycena epipterygia]
SFSTPLLLSADPPCPASLPNATLIHLLQSIGCCVLDGCIVFNLFGRRRPQNCRQLPQALPQWRVSSAKGYTYAGSKFYRIITSVMLQGGDFTRHRLQAQAHQAVPPQHRECGAEHEWITVFVTTMVTSWLDGKHVVFGE